MKLETLRKFPSVNALNLQVATQLLCTLQRLREEDSKRPDGTLKTPEEYLSETAEWDE